MTATKAIRLKCLDCSNGSANEVSNCPVERCPLYAWRFGKNPYRKKRELSPEHLEKLQKGRIAAKAHSITNEFAENGKAETSYTSDPVLDKTTTKEREV